MRLLGVALIYLTHTLSITDNDSLASFHGFRIGRVGTSLFFIVGGYMAAATSLSPGRWITKRLQRLLIPYWIVLIPTFIAVGFTGYKSFDAWQVVAQFLGLGLFTHPTHLINVTTWFISAILVLYLVTYVAKRSKHDRIVVAAVLTFTMLLGQLSSDPRVGWVSIASAFLVAYLLPRSDRYAVPMAIAVGLLLLVSLPLHHNGNLKHVGTAFLVFAAILPWRQPWPPLARVAEYSYEWFLVHGPALHAVKLIVGSSFWPVFWLGIAISIVAALILKSLTRAALDLAIRLSTWSFSPHRVASQPGIPDCLPEEVPG